MTFHLLVTSLFDITVLILNRHSETEELIKLTKSKAPIIDKARCGWKAPCKYSIGMIRYSRKRKYSRKDTKEVRLYVAQCIIRDSI